jgi:hypothetical protein
MFAHAKGILIVICVLFCTLSLLGGRSSPPPASRPGSSQDRGVAADASTSLVEAFAVEVNLPALATLGVSPIGEEPHAVSVPDILKCLGNGQARVIAGAKAACEQGSTAIQERRTIYMKREMPQAGRVDYAPYDSGRMFSVSSNPVSDTAPTVSVSVQFKFSHNLFTRKAQDSSVPPDTTTWEWSGSVVLEPGRPAIAAATQDGETAVFLLLTAHVQGR